MLSIGFQPRFDANMQMIKKIVQSGALGEVYYIQTGGGRRRGIPNSTFIEQRTAGIGALGDIGCYSLDMVLNAIGYPKPLTVTGYTSNFFGTSLEYSAPENACRFNVDDFAAAFVRLEGGIILDFRIAWAMHMDTPGDTIILGKKAGLRIPSTDCWNGSVGGPMTIYHDVAGTQCQTTIPIQENRGPGPLRQEDPFLPRRSAEQWAVPGSVQPDSLQPGYHRRYLQICCCRPRNQHRNPRNLRRCPIDFKSPRTDQPVRGLFFTL